MKGNHQGSFRGRPGPPARAVLAALVVLTALLATGAAFAGGSFCGNGVVEPGEDCDGQVCCNFDCTFATKGSPCSQACLTNGCFATGFGECSTCAGDAALCVPDNSLCDDGNPCTADVCLGSFCTNYMANDGLDCSDGFSCNGQETCQSGVCTQGSAPEVSCTPPPSGMVGWWPGDGDASDIQGGNDGTLNTVGFAAAEVSQGFSFNGNGVVDLGNPAALKLSTAITIDAWVYPTTLSDNLQAVVTKWSQDASNSSTSDSYGLWLQTNGTTLQIFSALHLSDGAEVTFVGGVIPLNTFSHVAMTYDATTGVWTLYVNGQAVSFTTLTPRTILATDAVAGIGREAPNVFRPFTGLIDEVEVFGRALSQTEIQSIVNACSAGKCKGCQSDAECQDSDPCTTDTCSQGTCSHAAVSCDDGNACTIDVCGGPGLTDTQDVCSHIPRLCNDENPCTTDFCDVEKGCTSQPKSCDDGDPCTSDLCDPRVDSADHCVHQARSCDDQNPCTIDSCNQQGQCVHEAVICDDGNVCTDERCDAQTGRCVYTPNTRPCDFGPAFSDGEGTCQPTGGVCSGGQCIPGGQPLCPVATIEADTTVREAKPTSNYGKSIELEADDPPYENRTLIKFKVRGTNGQHITKATLRLFSALTTSSGGRVRVTNCSWSETTVTWLTKPPFSTVLDSEGPLVKGQRALFDITDLVKNHGDGTYCVGIDNILDDEDYNSREAAAGRPDVILETECPCTPVVASVTADATVVNTTPNTNYGLDTSLGVDYSPKKLTFVKVQVSGVGGQTIKSARLRLQVANLSGSDSDKGGSIKLVPAAQCGWGETTITYANRPTSAGSTLSSIGSVKAGQLVEFDLKSTIPGDGSYCYRIESSSSNGADYNSRQGPALRPELVLVVTP